MGKKKKELSYYRINTQQDEAPTWREANYPASHYEGNA